MDSFVSVYQLECGLENLSVVQYGRRRKHMDGELQQYEGLGGDV